MFTNKTASYYSQDKVLIEAACLSTDTKPTTGVANGSKCIEMDTGKRYMFNEEDSEWEELPSSGGGGDTTVEALSVTQNGTYTAPSGKAYSPVTVNVSGGSSDFSTAEVTVNIQGGEIDEMSGCVAVDDPDYGGYSVCTLVSGETSTVILYKGRALVVPLESYSTNEATGGIVYDEDSGNFIVTGDGTISVSM